MDQPLMLASSPSKGRPCLCHESTGMVFSYDCMYCFSVIFSGGGAQHRRSSSHSSMTGKRGDSGRTSRRRKGKDSHARVIKDLTDVSR